MQTIKIINDLHVGASRVAGTTQDSAAALREYAMEQLRTLLKTCGNSHVVILGDMTDAFNIPLSDALNIYEELAQHLDSNPQSRVALVLGNHSLSKDSSVLGTEQFVGALLGLKHPDRFRLISEPTDLGDGVYVVPHLRNQSLFDLALSEVPDGVKYLMLHCNFDNNFAVQNDFSLNISREQVREFRDRGITTILGHEHQGRTAFAGKLIVIGNQFPTSVADCLAHGDGQKEGVKNLLEVGDAGVSWVPTWYAKDEFAEHDWQDLINAPEVRFIRVTGQATAEQSPAVVRAIATLRQRSKAFVITNAVKVSQTDSLDDLAESAEQVNSINVMDMLLSMLSDDQAAVVRSLQGK